MLQFMNIIKHFWIILFLFPISLLAQNTETETIFNPKIATFWANAEYIFENGNFAFLETRLHSTKGANSFDAQLGYEFRFSQKWSGGLAVRKNWQEKYDWLSGRIYAAHNGKIRSIEFLKILSAEYFRSDFQKLWRTRLQLAISRNFQLKKGFLRPILSFELFKEYPIPENSYPKRIFDRSELRAELAYAPIKNFSFSFFYLHPTDYFKVLAIYNAQNQLISPDRNLNILSPTFGIRLHYYLSNPKLAPERSLRNLGY